MGLRKLGGFEQLPTINLERDGIGTKTTVTFLDFKENVGNFSKTIYTCEYNGEKSQFWGNTVLDRVLSEASRGDVLDIFYRGEKPAKVKGQHPFKDFEVFLHDEAYTGNDLTTEAATAPQKKSDIPF